jgi:hypothetical protein
VVHDGLLLITLVMTLEEMATGPEAASTMILLICAGQRVPAPERHEVDPSGAPSF